MSQPMDTLIAALREKGSADRVARTLGVSTYTTEGWWKHKYHPGLANLARIKARWPDLAALVQAVQDDVDTPHRTGLSKPH